MWISNTATAAMMFPIGLSIVSHLSTQPIATHPQFRRFATTLMLITAFGASIGGMATPIGTPPNLIGVGMLRELVGAPISFFRWMVIGLPISMALYAVLAAGFWLVGRPRPSSCPRAPPRWCAANSTAWAACPGASET